MVADDSLVIGDISVLKTWLYKLLVVRPSFRYYPQLSKSNLILKKSLMSSAEQLFSSSGVTVVQSGKYLGGVIGDQAVMQSFMTSKVCVCTWSCYVELLSSIAVNQPQVTFIALTRSL